MFEHHGLETLRSFHAQPNILTVHNRLLSNQLGLVNSHFVERDQPRAELFGQAIPAGNIGFAVPQNDAVNEESEPQPTKKKSHAKQKCSGEMIRRLIQANGSMNIYLGRGGT
jgi:hypothetical protein